MNSRRFNVTAISAEPLILTGNMIVAHGHELMAALERMFAARPIYLLHQLWWTREPDEPFNGTMAFLNEAAIRFPRISQFVLCNSEKELARFRGAGIASALVSLNAFIDETVFDVAADATVCFDAVYNAALSPFKRIELAVDVAPLALIFAPWHRDAEGGDAYSRQLRVILPSARFINQPSEDAPYRMLSSAEVAATLNQARIGLCLSAMEGSMRASMKYLLCGLPVVSTPSIGGRDLFFDEAYCRIVSPEKSAIAEAVATLIAERIPRHFIRAATLARLAPQRERFIRLTQAIYDREYCARNFADEWPAYLRRASHTWRSIDELMSQIAGLAR